MVSLCPSYQRLYERLINNISTVDVSIEPIEWAEYQRCRIRDFIRHESREGRFIANPEGFM